ncbi:Proton-dependent oligopeptide transporter family - like 10, partial [Theobroma cacao]
MPRQEEVFCNTIPLTMSATLDTPRCLPTPNRVLRCKSIPRISQEFVSILFQFSLATTRMLSFLNHQRTHTGIQCVTRPSGRLSSYQPWYFLLFPRFILFNLFLEKLEVVEGKVDWKGKAAVKYKHGGMRAALFILVTFAFENMANLHLAVNLVTFFNGILHFEIADAANALTNFMGTGYILSILFGVLADSYIGRFKTVLISGSIEFLGLALLSVQAHFPSLKPSACNVFDPTSHCEKIKRGDAAFLYIALYLVAAGTGGIKAAVPSHGADQFDEKDSREAKHMSSFFNLLLLAVCLGGAVSLTLIVWVDDHKGWDLGFMVSAIAMVLGVIIAVAGWPLYRIHIVQGTSVIVEIIQVYVAAIRNRNLQLPENPLELYEIDKDKEAAVEADLLPHRNVY